MQNTWEIYMQNTLRAYQILKALTKKTIIHMDLVL